MACRINKLEHYAVTTIRFGGLGVVAWLTVTSWLRTRSTQRHSRLVRSW